MTTPTESQLLGAATLPDAQILLVDDEPANILLLQRILGGAGYTNLISAKDGYAALELCECEAFDLILLDLMMPGCDGFTVLRELAPLLAREQLPVMMLTADASRPTKQRALDSGARDFLTKPFDAVEVLLRVKNLLETRLLTLQMRDFNRRLEERVASRTEELSESYDKLVIAYAQLEQWQRAVEQGQMEVLQRLTQAAELRDDDTGQHTLRVGELSARLAAQLGLSREHIELIRRAAPLHDVGKIGVSDNILLKPGRLTPDEFALMKTHTVVGAHLLSSGQSEFVRAAEAIALNHHERFDGSGYPHGKHGEDIPLEGRIVSVVDVFDALTHERPYKVAWSEEAALNEIEAQRGRQFDPRIVDAFVAMIRSGAV